MKEHSGPWAFDIPLTFACLREAKARILAFELFAFNSDGLTLRLEDY